ncbi:MAG: hypothetical protein OEY52_01805 [Gammaproteobacteria bacterium]|nr:hypothetical protein [Gammaproteobacteria bacterium]
MTDISKYILGEHNQNIELSTSAENLTAAVALIHQARKTIDIYSHVLDPKVFNQSTCIEALKNFVLKSPYSRIRILIRSPQNTLRSGHRLILLARHLSSYIAIRAANEEYSHDQDAFLIADQRGMIQLQEGDRYDGICNFNNPELSVELSNRFENAWNHSSENTEFRQLVI